MHGASSAGDTVPHDQAKQSMLKTCVTSVGSSSFAPSVVAPGFCATSPRLRRSEQRLLSFNPSTTPKASLTHPTNQTTTTTTTRTASPLFKATVKPADQKTTCRFPSILLSPKYNTLRTNSSALFMSTQIENLKSFGTWVPYRSRAAASEEF